MNYMGSLRDTPTIGIEQTDGGFAHPLVHRIASAGEGRARPAAPWRGTKRSAKRSAGPLLSLACSPLGRSNATIHLLSCMVKWANMGRSERSTGSVSNLTQSAHANATIALLLFGIKLA